MKSIITKSALPVIAALSLAACSTTQAEPQAASTMPHTGQVYENYPHDPNDDTGGEFPSDPIWPFRTIDLTAF